MSILAVDIGGTKTLVGVADASGRILADKRIETPGSLGPERAIAATMAAARQVIGEASASVELIGIGCGGPVDRRTGTLHNVPNLPGWNGLCLTQIFAEEFGAPAYVDNDATAAALGELMFGAGRGVNDFAYFTVSTGIGGGLVLGGRVYRGSVDYAGEFGHQKIRPDGPQCNCGDRGCLEALSSGTSIARIAREGIADGAETVLREWTRSPDDITAELVARAAEQGDQFASRVWYDAMHNLGLGVANVVNILNPRLVIIGGGVARAGDMFFDPVREVVRKRAMKALADGVKVVPSANGDLVGLMGAIAVAVEGTQ